MDELRNFNETSSLCIPNKKKRKKKTVKCKCDVNEILNRSMFRLKPVCSCLCQQYYIYTNSIANENTYTSHTHLYECIAIEFIQNMYSI